MKNDIKYILKRVIVGVIIGIVLFNIKSCQVNAAELPTSYNRSLLNGLQFPAYNKFRYVGITANGMTDRTVADWMSSDLTTRYYYITGLYNDANGFAFSFLNDNVFVVGHNYNVALVYCTTTGVINGYRQFSVGTGTSFQNATANAGTNQNLQKDYSNLGSFNTDAEDFTTCFLAQVNFTADVGGNVLAFKFWNSAGRVSMGTLAFMGYYIDDLGQDFTTFKNQIINNITSSQTNIINNNNQNTQSIINNQNENTQQQIESQKVCFDYAININSDNKDNYSVGYLNSNGGNIGTDTRFVVSNYYSINKNTMYNLSFNSSVTGSYYCIYDTNKTLISCFEQRYGSIDFYSTSDGYVRYSARVDNNSNYNRFTGQYCGNGNQQISGQITDVQDKQDITNDKLNDINNTMNDSSTDSPNSGINAVKNGLASNGVITQLITLPVTLFQQILTSINGTCQTFNLGALFGTNLTLPCINVANYLGSALWGIIDVIISGYFVWVIARKMISAFEMFSAMKDGDVLDD